MTSDELPAAVRPAWIDDNLDEIKTWGPAPVGRDCLVPACSREALTHGLCKTHHQRAKRAWSPSPSQESYRRESQSAGVVLPPDEERTDGTGKETTK